MNHYNRLIRNLTTLNRVMESLNQAVHVQDALDNVLVRIVDLMGLKTGWIFLSDPSSQNRWAGRGFILAAQYNLPPAMSAGKARPWKGSCDCQMMCNANELSGAYNEVHCSRLANSVGNRRDLQVHATAPLRSGSKTMGMLNVAAEDWSAFSEEALVLLTNVGGQIGITLERARLFELLKERRFDEQVALLELSNQLLRRHQPQDLLEYIVREVCGLLSADAAAILLCGDQPNTLTMYAAHGWRHDPVATKRTIPVSEDSGLGMIVPLQKSLIIEDLANQSQIAQFPAWLVTEQFRGMALLPLLADDEVLGALMITTHTPRVPSGDELRLLKLFANQSALALGRMKLQRLEVKRQRMEEELSVARRIQESLLPQKTPTFDKWDIAAFYRPARVIGGDFYDFFQLPGKPPRLGMVIGDVADKGVAAALFMALSRSIIRTKAMSGPKPPTVLKRANRLILKDTTSDLFLTAFYGILNLNSGELVFTNAGHNRPLWYQIETGAMTQLSTLGIVLGVFDPIQLGEGKIDIAPGDTLVVYTDGVTEAMDVHENLFGDERLQTVIDEQAKRNADAKTMTQAIVDAVETFVDGVPQSDDLTLFVVKRRR